MIRLYLVRHGETEWNRAMRFQGWTDIELSKEGKKQAQVVGKRFETIKIDEIYSSPLKRAVATAEPISKAANVPIFTHDGFKEINFGEWEGLTAKEISEKWGSEFDEFMKKPEELTFPGEISFEHVKERLKEGLNVVLKGKDDKNIVIVSHGGIIRLIIKHLIGFKCEWYNKTWIDNTSISVVEIRKRGNLLRVLNDCSHLDNGILR